MYLEHFGLSQPPFNLTPDPDYLYLSGKHRLGLSLLRYGLSEAGGGITVITGHIGAGKTTLLRKLLQELDYSELNIGLINNTIDLQEHLIRWVASAFQLEYEGRESLAIFREFQQYLIDQYARGKQTVLIIDEAQNLNEKSLEELRLLTNINAERDQLLKIVLVGQPELLDRLSAPKLAQIAQRVSVEYHLEAMNRDDTREYIRHRMEIAGSSSEVFSESAIDAIFYLSGGIPRLINTLCGFSLVFAFANDQLNIDITAVLEVTKGRHIGGVNRHYADTAEFEEIRQALLDEHAVDLQTLIKRAS